MRLMKKSLIATAVAGSLMASSAMAGVSMNVGATSDYVWRGISQNDGQAAISGGLDYSSDAGFYVGTWTSNTAWGSYELDGYAGFSSTFAEDFSYDVGYIYYAYPLATDADFGEVYGSLGWKGLTLFGAYQTNEQWDDAEDQYYVSLDYAFEYGEGFSSDFLAGYYGGDGTKDIYGDAFMNYYADISKSTDYGDITLAISYADLDGTYDGTPDGVKIDDPRVFVSWGKEF